MSITYIAKEVKANYASSANTDSGASKATSCIVNGSNTYQYRAFLQHDFSGIPCGSKIISAKLYVYAFEGNDNTAQGGHKFDAVISEWPENSITWNTQPSIANTPIPADWLVPTIGEWNSWDITELVQKWIYQIMPNNGLRFVNKDETGYRHNWKFYNRRYSEEYATYVEVEYEPITTNNEREFLGRDGTEQLVASVKTLVNELGAVSFKQQSLTSAQKTQARANLGITGTGADGYTPVKGTDYWTEADKAEIKSYVDEAIIGEFVLVDRTTGATYTLYADNGKLMMEEL